MFFLFNFFNCIFSIVLKLITNTDADYIENVNVLEKINSDFIIKYFTAFHHEFNYFIVLEYAEVKFYLTMLLNSFSCYIKI